MANYTPQAKLRLALGIEVLQKYGREGTIIADRLLKETPVESAEFDTQKFFAKLEADLKTQSQSHQ